MTAKSERMYSVREISDTIQGEGVRAGTRAVFVRFAGCNMWTGNPDDRGKGTGACAQWCDADFQFPMARKLTAENLAHHLDLLWPWDGQTTDPDRWLVLTGGEPLLQVDSALLFTLRDHGWQIAVETNGTVDPGPTVIGAIDHLCVSPKLLANGESPTLKLLGADELKVVLPGAVGRHVGWSDGALNDLADEGVWKAKIVQPQDPTDPKTVEVTALRGGYVAPLQLKQATDRCLHWVNKHPDWRIGIQVHKVLNLP